MSPSLFQQGLFSSPFTSAGKICSCRFCDLEDDLQSPLFSQPREASAPAGLSQWQPGQEEASAQCVLLDPSPVTHQFPGEGLLASPRWWVFLILTTIW